MVANTVDDGVSVVEHLEERKKMKQMFAALCSLKPNTHRRRRRDSTRHSTAESRQQCKQNSQLAYDGLTTDSVFDLENKKVGKPCDATHAWHVDFPKFEKRGVPMVVDICDVRQGVSELLQAVYSKQ